MVLTEERRQDIRTYLLDYLEERPTAITEAVAQGIAGEYIGDALNFEDDPEELDFDLVVEEIKRSARIDKFVWRLEDLRAVEVGDSILYRGPAAPGPGVTADTEQWGGVLSVDREEMKVEIETELGEFLFINASSILAIQKE